MPNLHLFNIEIENIKLKQLGVQALEVVPIKIDLDEVSAYHRSRDDDRDNEEITAVYLKSGINFGLFISFNEFDKKMMDYVTCP